MTNDVHDFMQAWATSEADLAPDRPPFRIADRPPPAYTALLFWRGRGVGWQQGYWSNEAHRGPMIVLGDTQRVPAEMYTHWTHLPPAPVE